MCLYVNIHKRAFVARDKLTIAASRFIASRVVAALAAYFISRIYGCLDKKKVPNDRCSKSMFNSRIRYIDQQRGTRD